jgi:hypothetical protein
MIRTQWTAAVALALITAAAPASAATWSANGTIRDVLNNTLGLLPNWVGIGDTYTFNYEVNPSAGSVEAFGVETYSRPFGASVTVNEMGGSNVWTYQFPNNLPTDFVQVANTGLGDAFNVQARGLNGLILTGANLNLSGSAAIFASTDFPASQPNYSAFGNRVFTFFTGLEGFTGTVEASPVPLPAAAWLMISGLGALAMFGRRRRRFETQAPLAT